MPAPASSAPNTLGVHIIVRDAERTIGALLRTVLNQGADGRPVVDEVVIVDTGSVDETRRLIEAAVASVQVEGDFDGVQAQWVDTGPEMAAQAQQIVEELPHTTYLDRTAAVEPLKVLILGIGEGHLIREVKKRWPNAQITAVDRLPPTAPAEVLEGVTVVTQRAEEYLASFDHDQVQDTAAPFHLGISDIATEFGADWRFARREDGVASDSQLAARLGAVCGVAVVATGSDERGCSVVDVFPDHLEPDEPLARFPDSPGEVRRYAVKLRGGHSIRFVLARLTWVNDFAYARNYSFNLGSCRWRMYLDADDTMPNIALVRRYIENTLATKPTANVFCFSYDYSVDVFQRDVERVFEWCGPSGEAVFQWEWALHEHVEPVGTRRKHKVLSPADGSLTVVHARDDHGAERSLGRNLGMLRALYANADERDAKTRWAFFLGENLLWTEQPGGAELLVEAATRADLFACYALCALAKHALLKRKAITAAIEAASQAAGRFPEQKMPLALLAVAHAAQNDAARATHAFNLYRAAGADGNESNMHDRLVCDVVLPLTMAKLYFATGDLEGTRVQLDAVNRDAVRESPYETAFLRLISKLEAERAVALYAAGVKAALIAADPMRARQLLVMAPAALQRSPKLRELAAKVKAKTDFAVGTWERYCAAYAAAEAPHIESEAKQHARISAMHRTRMLLKRVEQLARQRPEGEIRALSIGPYAAVMEKMAYDLCPRLRWTLVTPTDDSVAVVHATFGDAPHTVKKATDFFDWGTELFDLVILFEVMEHLPFERPEVISALAAHLAPHGTLMVSVPNPEMMCEGYLGDIDDKNITFYPHIAPNTVTGLWQDFRAAGFNINIMSGDADRALTVVATEGKQPQGQLPRIVIRAAGPLRFDALTHHEQALGGSEEAVIHLSHALAAMGHEVVVFAPLPERDVAEATSFRVSGNVLWLEAAEFMADDVRPRDVLFVWRDPAFAAKARGLLGPGARIVNWLHDTNYSVDPKLYGAVDATVVLSDFHVHALRHGDGYLPAEHGGRIDVLANGVDVPSLPLTQEQGGSIARHPHRVIYASSPDRGLELLTDIWPAVRAAVPDAELHVYYGWGTFDVLTGADPVKYAGLLEWAAALKRKIAELATQGVVYHGGVPHGALHEAFAAASVWAYPTVFPEIHCITAAKAQCLGAWPVCTDTGALRTTVCCGGDVLTGLGEALAPFYSDVLRLREPAEGASAEECAAFETAHVAMVAARERYTSHLIARLQAPPHAQERLAMINSARASFDWRDVAEDFSVVACRVAAKSDTR